MLFNISDKSKNMIPVYLLLIVSLFYFKPAILFKPNGKPREYGFGIDSEGYKKTLFTLHFMIIIIVCIIYFKYTQNK